MVTRLATQLPAIAAACLALTSCYSPSLRDCVVSCASESDCASGQICGRDGLCASPDLADHCTQITGPDASTGDHDAGPRDAGTADPPRDAGPDAAPPPPPDGPPPPPTVLLHIHIDGRGSVAVDGQGPCSAVGPQHGDCSYGVATGVSQTIHAMPIIPDQQFLGWTSTTCGGQGPTCTFTPIAATLVTVKFGHSGRDSL